MCYFKTLLSSAAIACCPILYGQITINETNFASAADTARFSISLDSTLDFSSTGTNFSWNFSTLTPDSQFVRTFKDVFQHQNNFVQLDFGNIAPPELQASYYHPVEGLPVNHPGAVSIITETLSDFNEFTRVTADSVTNMGLILELDGAEITKRAEMREKKYELPLNFGDSYTGQGFIEFDFSPTELIWKNRTSRSSVVDGWGTLDLSIGVFDVLRVRHTIEQTDSVNYDFLGTGTPDWVEFDQPTTYIYEWFASGEIEPMLRIITKDDSGTEKISYVEYRDVYINLTAQIGELSDEVVKIFPNPTQNSFFISGIEGEVEYQVVDILGNIVLQDETKNKAKNNISMLQPGVYTIIVGNTNNSRRKTLIIH